MSLKARLALLFTLGTAAVLAGGGALFVHELSASLHSSLLSVLTAESKVVEQNLPDAGQLGESRPWPAVGAAGADPAGAGAQHTGQFPPPPTLAEGGYLTQVLGRSGVVLEASNAPAHTPLVVGAELRAARGGAVVFERHVEGERSPVLVLASAVSGSPGLVVITGTSLGTLEGTVSRVETALLVAGPVGVLGAALAAWALASSSLSPVTRMRRQAAAISERDEDSRLVVPATGDEIADLATTLNALLDRLHGALSRERGFVAAAGHELRTPLAILHAELELAGRPGRSLEELRCAIGEAEDETERLIRLAEDLLVLASGDEGAPLVHVEPHDLVATVETSIAAFASSAARADVSLLRQGADSVPAVFDADRVRQVVDNLLANALRYAPAGSTVTVDTNGDGNEVAFEVRDEGPGFAPELLPHAFERFSRAETSRNRQHGGAGLGLAVVKTLVDAHGGRKSAVAEDPALREDRRLRGARRQVRQPVDRTRVRSWLRRDRRLVRRRPATCPLRLGTGEVSGVQSEPRAFAPGSCPLPSVDPMATGVAHMLLSWCD